MSKKGRNEIGRLQEQSLPISNSQEWPPEFSPDEQPVNPLLSKPVQLLPVPPFGPQTVTPSLAPVKPIRVSSRNVPNRSTLGVKYTRRLPVSCGAGPLARRKYGPRGRDV